MLGCLRSFEVHAGLTHSFEVFGITRETADNSLDLLVVSAKQHRLHERDHHRRGVRRVAGNAVLLDGTDGGPHAVTGDPGMLDGLPERTPPSHLLDHECLEEGELRHQLPAGVEEGVRVALVMITSA